MQNSRKFLLSKICTLKVVKYTSIALSFSAKYHKQRIHIIMNTNTKTWFENTVFNGDRMLKKINYILQLQDIFSNNRNLLLVVFPDCTREISRNMEEMFTFCEKNFFSFVVELVGHSCVEYFIFMDHIVIYFLAYSTIDRFSTQITSTVLIKILSVAHTHTSPCRPCL